MFGTILCSKLSWYWLQSSLPGTHFPFSSSNWLTVQLSICLLASIPPPSPPSVSPIVAISCLLCMNFDYSQGAILHLLPSSHTNTHRCKCAQKGREKYLPLEDLFIKCAVKSCQAFHIRAHFPASGYPKESIQTRVCHNVISTTFSTVDYSYSINRVLWMWVHRDHFIWIVNLCY